jgi:flagellar basal-body rod modification protein FlgD
MSSMSAHAVDASGNSIDGTDGSTVDNNSATELSSNEFLDLMMDELTHQDPTSADSSDPTEYLTQLAQMTSVEQEEQTASAENLQSAMSMVGATVTYTNSSTGESVTGVVDSVQVSDSTPTLTIDDQSGISLSSVTNVEPTPSSN